MTRDSWKTGQKVNHNRLERLRRDKIKESFAKLRAAVKVNKNTSRVDTLKATISYLRDMRQKKQDTVSTLTALKSRVEMLRQLVKDQERKMGFVEEHTVKEEDSDSSSAGDYHD